MLFKMKASIKIYKSAVLFIVILLQAQSFVLAQENSLKLLPIKENGNWGFINLKGEVVIKPQYNNVSDVCFNNYVIVQLNNKIGVVDTTGEILQDIKYSSLVALDSSSVKACKDSLCKLIKVRGSNNSVNYYADIQFLIDSFYVVQLNGRYGLASYSGDIIPANYKRIGVIENAQKPYFSIKNNNDEYGLCNNKGLVIIKPKYEKVAVLSDSVLMALKDGFWSGFDVRGKQILDSKWKHFYNEGKYVVLQKSSKEKALYDPINKKIITTAKYHGFRVLYNEYIETNVNGYKGIITKDGKEIVEPKYTFIYFDNTNNQYIWVKNGMLWGVLSINGKIILPPKYTHINSFGDGIFSTRFNGKYGIANIYGDEIFPPIADKVLVYDGVVKAYVDDDITVINVDKKGKELDRTDFSNVASVRINSRSFGTTMRSVQFSPSQNITQAPNWYYDYSRSAYGLKDSLDSIRFQPSYVNYQLVDSSSYSLVKYIPNNSDDFGERIGNYIASTSSLLGVIDHDAFKYVCMPKYKYIKIDDFSHSYYTLALTDLKHFSIISKNKNQLVKSYSYIDEFYDGIARCNTNGKLRTENFNSHESVIEAKWFFKRFEPFYSYRPVYNRYRDENEKEWVTFKGGLWGMLDETGKEVITPRYQFLDNSSHHSIIAKLNNNWGVISSNGKTIINFNYDYISRLKNSNDSLFLLKYKVVKNGLMDVDGNQLTLCDFDEINQFNNSLSLVRQDNLYGYINKSGDVQVKCIYKRATDFKNSYAAVRRNTKWGFIDTLGNVVVEEKYTRVGSFSEGVSWFYLKGRYGYINSDDSIVIPAEYRNAKDFIGGKAVVKKKGKYGVISMQNEWLLKPRFKAISIYEKDSVIVCRTKKGYVLVDFFGKKISNKKYKKMLDFKHGYAFYKEGSYYGIINNKGVEITEPTYQMAQDFSEDLAGVKYKGKWGFIDTIGNTVIPCIYNSVEPFTSVTTIAQKGSDVVVLQNDSTEIITYNNCKGEAFNSGYALLYDKVKRRYFYINQEGGISFGGTFVNANSFNNNIAFTKKVVHDSLPVGFFPKDDLYRVISNSGLPLTNNIYSNLEYLGEGMISYRIPAYYGLSDVKGEEILAARFDNIEYLGSNILRVESQNKTGYITTKAKWLWALTN